MFDQFYCFGERAHTRKGKMTQSSGVGFFFGRQQFSDKGISGLFDQFYCFGERAHTRKGKMTQSSGVGLFLADSSSRTRESVDLDVAVGFAFEVL
jgi:hypothetical protein